MHRIGIDIGGTFTDIAGFINERMYYAKAPSSPDVLEGVIGGVKMILEMTGVDPQHDSVEIVHIHGTTIATNALHERKGARLGLLTTEGHRDALEMGRMKRSNLYDMRAGPETPGFLARGRFRVGIRERIDGKGNIVKPLDEAQVVEEVRRLVDAFRIEALAICFLNSFSNNRHEERAAEILAEAFPNLMVSLSSRVNPTFREYERVCATAFDAYVRPKVEHYVKQLEGGLAHEGKHARLHLMQSSGGIASADMTVAKPVSMFLSGPAAGVIAARYVGEMSGRSELVGIDVGGTSTDVCLIRDGKAQITRESRIGMYPLRVPMVDIETVGSGGGSIAWIDEGGGLHVGPESAGSYPGPACYDWGGDKPTSSDAIMVLGYLNPVYFADGTVNLRPDLAEKVLTELGDRLGMSAVEAAVGVYRILVSQMAEAIKLVTIKRGIDPRDLTMVSFGGGGGAFAPAVAKDIGIKEVLVPRSPGTLSAFGMLVADFETDGVRTFFIRDTAEADCDLVEQEFRKLEAQGEETLASEGLNGVKVLHRRTAEMRYEGQGYELEVPLGAVFDEQGRADAVEAFHRVHNDVFGHFNRERTVELVNLRLVSYQPADPLPSDAVSGALPAEATDIKPTGICRASFPDLGEVATPRYRRMDLPVGFRIEGPAIFDQPDTTVVIGKGQEATIDAAGNMIIRS